MPRLRRISASPSTLSLLFIAHASARRTINRTVTQFSPRKKHTITSTSGSDKLFFHGHMPANLHCLDDGRYVAQNLGLNARPNLFVLVLIELLRPDFLETAWGKLTNGGFRKLLIPARIFQTAGTWPAHSATTLATRPRRMARRACIVADSWWDHRWRQTVKASEEELLATTVAGQIAAEAGTRVYWSPRTRLKPACRFAPGGAAVLAESEGDSTRWALRRTG